MVVLDHWDQHYFARILRPFLFVFLFLYEESKNVSWKTKGGRIAILRNYITVPLRYKGTTKYSWKNGFGSRFMRKIIFFTKHC